MPISKTQRASSENARVLWMSHASAPTQRQHLGFVIFYLSNCLKRLVTPQVRKQDDIAIPDMWT